MRKTVVILLHVLAGVECFTPSIPRHHDQRRTAMVQMQMGAENVHAGDGKQLDRRSAILGTIAAVSVLVPVSAHAVVPGTKTAESSTIPEWTLEGGVKMPSLALRNSKQEQGFV